MGEIYSVVIPAYNAEATIECCLDSVAAQTLAPLEVLVVDDCSTDGTAAAVFRCEERLSKAGVRFVYHRLDKNSGPSVARNHAIRAARGSFIAFLDADDVWHRNKLEIIDRFIATSNAGLIFHSYSQDAAFSVNNRQSIEYKTNTLSICRILLQNPAATPCTAVRFRPGLAFDETMRYCEDYDLWLRIAEIAPILQLIGPPLTRLGRPLLSSGGLSGSTTKMRVGEARVYFKFWRRAWLTRAWLLPNLLVFSFLKHLYSTGRRFIN